MIELTMQVSEFDYTETLDTFLPDLIKILSESEGVNPQVRRRVARVFQEDRQGHPRRDEPQAEGSAHGQVFERLRIQARRSGK